MNPRFTASLWLALAAAGCRTDVPLDGREGLDGAALGRSVCACTEAANTMEGSDPDRPAAQERCRALHQSTWETVRGTPQQDNYNAQFPCGF